MHLLSYYLHNVKPPPRATNPSSPTARWTRLVVAAHSLFPLCSSLVCALSLAWQRAGDCVLMWGIGVAIVALSEALYQGRGDLLEWPAEGGHLLFWWMFQYVISRTSLPPLPLLLTPPLRSPSPFLSPLSAAVNIFLSPRFARVVDLLWLGPVFVFYAKLYLYFLTSTTLVVATFSPLPLRLGTST